MSSNIRISRICQHCGKEFTAKTTVTKYCSDHCSKRAYKQRERDSKIQKSGVEMEEIKQKPAEEIKARDFLTVKEVAFLLRCTPRAINKMIQEGRLPAVQLSQRKTLVKRSELDKIFESPMPAVVYKVEPKKKEYKIEDCYTIAEAEERAAMSSKALYEYIKRNNIPKIQKGKYIYVPKELIDPLAK